MAVQVYVPTPLRKLTGNQSRVGIEGRTVGQLLGNLENSFCGIGKKLLDENGALRPYLNLYVNDEDIRFLQDLDTPLKDGDRVSIVPAIAGG